MAKLITANNAVTVLDGALSLSATTLVLTDISNFPVLVDVDDYCILTLIRASDGAIEYVKCTSQNVPNRSYEILRGQESTVALDFLDGDEARNLLTSDQIETLRTVSDDKLPLAGGALTGALDLGGNTIGNLAPALDPDEAPNLQQVLDLINAVSPTLLTSIDMTNGGANDLSNIDITWQTAWDAYDKVEIVVDDMESTGVGQAGLALSPDGGTTWKSWVGGKQAFLWSGNAAGGAGVNYHAKAELNIKGHVKIPLLGTYSVSTGSDLGGNPSFTIAGSAGNYNGTTFSSLSSFTSWSGWDTGSNGLDGYMLRFAHDNGPFTSGTFKIIGYNYPS